MSTIGQGKEINFALSFKHIPDDQLAFNSTAFTPDSELDSYRPGIVVNHPERTTEWQLRAMRSSYLSQRVFPQWRVYHFHDTSSTAAVKQSADLHDNAFLRRDAGNLASFLFMLREKHPRHYEQIRDTMRLAVPFFDDLSLYPSHLNQQTILLRWREQGIETEFNANQLSDGTLRFLCLTTLLLQPDEFLPHAILIDEPELGLHPYAILLLTSMLRSASQRAQVIVSTQSVPLLDQLLPQKDDVQDVVVVDRRDQQSVFRRLDPAALSDWLEEYSPSELWEKGVLGGSPV